MRSNLAHGTLVIIWVALVGCAPSRPPLLAPKQDYPGVLRDPSSIPGDFMARQTVEARYGSTNVRFDAVLQKRGSTLTLLGFTPFGTRAFLLRQVGTDVSFTQYVGRDLPFPPKYILFDIDRSLFIGIPGSPQPDGEHTDTVDGEQIRETWAGGKLLERHFRRLDGKPAGDIDIKYVGGMTAAPPSRIEFHNGWFGYDLSIDIHSYQPLAPP
jgi:hypothetical protein